MAGETRPYCLLKPTGKFSWNLNYYEGQEQRDVVPDLNPGLPALPTQPGSVHNPGHHPSRWPFSRHRR